MSTNTVWERIPISDDMLKYLRGTHSLWSRLAEGEHMFIVLLNGQTPKDSDSGYHSIAAALKDKGLD